MKPLRIDKHKNGRVYSLLVPTEDNEGYPTVTVDKLRHAIQLLEDDADLLETAH